MTRMLIPSHKATGSSEGLRTRICWLTQPPHIFFAPASAQQLPYSYNHQVTKGQQHMQEGEKTQVKTTNPSKKPKPNKTSTPCWPSGSEEDHLNHLPIPQQRVISSIQNSTATSHSPEERIRKPDGTAIERQMKQGGKFRLLAPAPAGITLSSTGEQNQAPQFTFKLILSA